MSNPGFDNRSRQVFRFILKLFGRKLISKFSSNKRIVKKAWNDIDLDKLNFFINHHNEIPGWFDFNSIKVFLSLDQLQAKHNVKGDICELGVFCGKSTVLFMILNERTSAKITVCDYFPMDRLDKFLFYKKHFVSETLNIEILQKDTQKIVDDEVSSNNKMIYLDAGHSYKNVQHDIAFYSNKLSERGILILDDYLNQGFPGVNMATNEFIAKNKVIAPFLCAFGKLYCCRIEDKPWFDEQLTELFSTDLLKFMVPRLEDLNLNGHTLRGFRVM